MISFYISLVKEELTNDDAKLVVENGRAVCFLVPVETGMDSTGCNGEKSKSQSSLNDMMGSNNENKNNRQQHQQQQQMMMMMGNNGFGGSSSSSSSGLHQMNRKSKSNYDSLTRKHDRHNRPSVNTPLK